MNCGSAFEPGASGEVLHHCTQTFRGMTRFFFLGDLMIFLYVFGGDLIIFLRSFFQETKPQYTHPSSPSKFTPFCSGGLFQYISVISDSASVCVRVFKIFIAKIVQFVSFTGAFTGVYVVKPVK